MLDLDDVDASRADGNQVDFVRARGGMGRVIQIGEQNPGGLRALKLGTQPLDGDALALVDEFPAGQESNARLDHVAFSW